MRCMREMVVGGTYTDTHIHTDRQTVRQTDKCENNISASIKPKLQKLKEIIPHAATILLEPA